jgi:hypothetical protein
VSMWRSCKRRPSGDMRTKIRQLYSIPEEAWAMPQKFTPVNVVSPTIAA